MKLTIQLKDSEVFTFLGDSLTHSLKRLGGIKGIWTHDKLFLEKK
jgi:hypothetical protein